MAAGLLSVLAGIVLIGTLPQQMMPAADRNQFAVEISLPAGTAIERTAQVADSVEHILRRDSRVVSVTSFKSCSSPRFQNSYAPQIAGTNYAQFIVNTTGVEETVQYTPRYTDAFPDARVRFKQLTYSEAVYPVEFRLSGENLDTLRRDASKLLALMRNMPELILAYTDLNEPLHTAKVILKENEATRLGINNATVENILAMRYGSGLPVGTVWDGDYDQKIVLKGTHADRALSIDMEYHRQRTNHRMVGRFARHEAAETTSTQCRKSPCRPERIIMHTDAEYVERHKRCL